MARRTVLVVSMATRAAALFLLWLVLVDTVREAELITGAVVALAAAALAGLVRPFRSVRVRIGPRMLRYAYRPFLLLVTDSARVTVALMRALLFKRPIQGRLRAVRYEAVGDGPEMAARRVLTEWAASVGPNRYAIGVDAEAQLLLVHELVPAAGPLDPLELG